MLGIGTNLVFSGIPRQNEANAREDKNIHKMPILSTSEANIITVVPFVPFVRVASQVEIVL